jgi:hypothetical protein
MTEEGLLLGLGLSFKNIKRMKKGEPILIDTEELGMGKGKILIFAGESEKVMEEELKGHLGPETQVHRPKYHECAREGCAVRLFDPKEKYCQHHEANIAFGVEEE